MKMDRNTVIAGVTSRFITSIPVHFYPCSHELVGFQRQRQENSIARKICRILVLMITNVVVADSGFR